jgi:cytochrome P450
MINLSSPSFFENPYPILNDMREKHPFCEIEPGNTWVLSRYDDVKEALNNYSLFTSARKAEQFIPDWLREDIRPNFFLPCADPPDHLSRRSAISAPFARNKIQSLRPLMIETAEKLAAEIRAREHVEFLRNFAYPYISKIFGYITNLDTLQPLEETYEWIKALELSSTPHQSTQDIQHIESIIIKQRKLFEDVVQDRRKTPADDLISSWVHSTLNGEPLSTDQLINIIELMIRAGFQSTVHMLAASIIQLRRRPDIHKQLVDSPVLMPAFVNELLRLYSSVPLAVRHTTQEVTLHGRTAPAGAQVWLSLAAANRDPRRFDNPDEFYLTHPPSNKPIPFGFGPHNCLGQHLGLLEVEMATRSLLPLIENMSLPEDRELRWIKTLDFRGLEELTLSISDPIIQ